MGLGPEPPRWEGYEWFDPHAVRELDDSYLEAGLASLRRQPLWLPGPSLATLPGAEGIVGLANPIS